MTREEAIEILRTRVVPTRNWQEIHEAVDMAIEALSEDKISRAELFNRLAVVKSPAEANEYKAEVYKIINEM